MTIEEVKGAMENFSFELQYNEYRYANSEIQAMQTALKVLENELERMENKPLDLEALKNMIGEPIWISNKNPIYSCWDLISEVKKVWGDEDAFLISTEANDYISEWNTFHKYKPQEMQDEQIPK